MCGKSTTAAPAVGGLGIYPKVKVEKAAPPSAEEVQALDELIERTVELRRELDRKTIWIHFEPGHTGNPVLGAAYDALEVALKAMRTARQRVETIMKPTIVGTRWVS